jgi:hypothetical protein
MNDKSLERIDREILVDEISGGALEASAGAEGATQMLPCTRPAFLAATFATSPCRRP